MERVKQEIRSKLIYYLDGLIKEAGNVTAFAKSIGVSRDSVNNWLSGKSDIRLNDLVAISKKYNKSVDYLLGLSKYPTLKQDEKQAAAYTGLSTNAVAVLHDLEEERKRNKAMPGLSIARNKVQTIELASALITSPSFVRLLESLDTIHTVIYDFHRPAP